MKIEASLLKNKIKKDKVWLAIYLSSFLICVIYVFLNYETILNNKSLALLLIGYPTIKIEENLIYTLYNLYTITYLTYFSITYLNEEIENYSDNLIIREKSKKWIIRKIITIILSVAIIKLINIFATCILLNCMVSIKYILISLLYASIMALIGISLNISIKDTSLTVILSLVISYLTFFYIQNIPIILIIGMLLVFYNYLSFSFKKIYKIKNS